MTESRDQNYTGAVQSGAVQSAAAQSDAPPNGGGPNTNVATVAELGTLAGAQLVADDLAQAGIPSRIVSDTIQVVGDTANVGTFVIVVPAAAAQKAFDVLEADLELIEPEDDMGFLSGRPLWQQALILVLGTLAVLAPIALALAAVFNSVI
jgi:hypothetical protein